MTAWLKSTIFISVLRYNILCILTLFVTLEAIGAESWRVSTSGFGPAHTGMSLKEASQALGAELTPDGKISLSGCYYVKPKMGFNGLAVLVARGHVLGFDIYGPGIKSLSGLGVGDTEARILEVFGQSVEVTPHKYLPANGKYLTVWSSSRKLAVRFETYMGKVTSFYSGRAPAASQGKGCV